MRHPVDLAGGAVLRFGPRRLRFFTEGWGDEALLARDDLPTGPAQPITVAWRPTMHSGDLLVTDGSFDSPASDLPLRSRRAQVRLIAPAAGHERTCLLMAAWNDHDYTTRTRLARALCTRGIAALLLHQPYYGPRRPDPDLHQPIRTVSDFMVMGRAALEEGRSLLAMLGSAGFTAGVSGYSMGGTMAALIGATTTQRVAVAPLAAAHSPAPVYLDGVLRDGIAWSALGGEDHAERLRGIMLTASALRLPPQPHLAGAVIVAARNDAYVPAAATTELAAHWPGCELRTGRGGHATLLWLRTSTLASAIAGAFRRTFD